MTTKPRSRRRGTVSYLWIGGFFVLVGWLARTCQNEESTEIAELKKRVESPEFAELRSDPAIRELMARKEGSLPGRVDDLRSKRFFDRLCVEVPAGWQTKVAEDGLFRSVALQPEQGMAECQIGILKLPLDEKLVFEDFLKTFNRQMVLDELKDPSVQGLVRNIDVKFLEFEQDSNAEHARVSYLAELSFAVGTRRITVYKGGRDVLTRGGLVRSHFLSSAERYDGQSALLKAIVNSARVCLAR